MKREDVLEFAEFLWLFIKLTFLGPLILCAWIGAMFLAGSAHDQVKSYDFPDGGSSLCIESKP